MPIAYTGLALNEACAVRVGSQGTIEKSVDGGATWTLQTSGTPADIIGVVWTGSRFIAADKNGQVIVAGADADDWVVYDLTNREFKRIAMYQSPGGIVIAVAGLDGALYVCNTSIPDNVNDWISTDLGVITTQDLYAVIAAVVFVVGGENGFIASTIGTTTVGTNTWRAGAFAHGGVMVMVGDNGAIARSDNNGRSWALVPSGTTKSLKSVKYSEEAQSFAAVGVDDTVLVSTGDGATWEAQ